jgi:hypothetical protein
VAAITGTFEGIVTLADQRPPASYRLTVQGQGRPGFVIGDTTVTLAPDTDGTTVTVDANVQVGGLVAQIGQRLLGTTARMMMDRFFKCLEQKAAIPEAPIPPES